MCEKTSLLLPGTTGIAQAVDEARRALCAFLELDAEPRALAAWLEHPYREATRFCPAGRAFVRTDAIVPTIVDAQRSVARLIEAAAQGGDALARRLPAVVRIRAAHDRFGGKGFVPFDAPGSRLVDRAVALVLADYLTRPDDFLAHGYPTAASHLLRISGSMGSVSGTRKLGGSGSAAA